MKIVICLPTYNENENIELIIQAIFEQSKYLGDVDLNILVIDDNSPDDTADTVISLQSDRPNLHLITGKKEGLGKAYIRGFNYAIEQLKADAVMEMDADFSHDPADIPRMVKELLSGNSFVIGSRYVPGGSIPHNWGLFRKMNSRVGNIFARHIAGLGHVKDCTAGFRAISVPLLKKIDVNDLRVKGYAFQIALLDRAINAGAIVKEIPVDFINRKYGETKMAVKDILEFMLNCWWIRFEKIGTFIKFVIVGFIGVGVNLGAFTALYNGFKVNKFIASPLAIEISIVSNFLLNNYWTFKKRNVDGSTGIKGLKFNIVSIAALTISYATFITFSKIVPNLPPQVSQLLGIIPATLVNYFLNSYWTFKGRVE